ncbi:hypothetical protein J6590_083859 [Homalodisca vitripennis]|nr:hypothetical protein J6590_083859 [Homalodisca vitripennis]
MSIALDRRKDGKEIPSHDFFIPWLLVIKICGAKTRTPRVTLQHCCVIPAHDTRSQRGPNTDDTRERLPVGKQTGIARAIVNRFDYHTGIARAIVNRLDYHVSLYNTAVSSSPTTRVLNVVPNTDDTPIRHRPLDTAVDGITVALLRYSVTTAKRAPGLGYRLTAAFQPSGSVARSVLQNTPQEDSQDHNTDNEICY